MIWVAWLLIAAGHMVVASKAPASPELQMVGNKHAVWIYWRRYHEESGQPLSQFAVRGRAADHFISPPRLSGLVGDLDKMILVGNDLHVFYEDGSHGRYRLTGNGLVEMNAERPLPLKAKPHLLVGANDAYELLAVVSREAAHQIKSDALESSQASGDSTEVDVETNDSTTLQMAPITEIDDTQFWLVRYEGSNWSIVTNIPDWFDGHKAGLLEMNSEGGVHLIYENGDSGYRYYSYWDTSAWSQPLRLRVPNGGRLMALTWRPSGPRLLKSNRPNPAYLEHLVVSVEGSIAEQNPIQLPMTWNFVVASGFGEQWAVCGSNEDEVHFGIWSGENRDWMLEPSAVIALNRSVEASRTARMQTWISLIALLMLLTFVFIYRKESLVKPLQLPAQYEVPSYWRRALGFSVDLAPVAWLTSSNWWPEMDLWITQLQVLGEASREFPPLSDALLRGWFVMSISLIAYRAIFEWTFATTPGKLVVQCRVVSEKGRRCGLAQIVVRNLVLLVELFPLFQLVPSLVLLLFTRNRQRMGDLFARTVVVRRIEHTSTHEQHEV